MPNLCYTQVTVVRTVIKDMNNLGLAPRTVGQHSTELLTTNRSHLYLLEFVHCSTHLYGFVLTTEFLKYTGCSSNSIYHCILSPQNFIFHQLARLFPSMNHRIKTNIQVDLSASWHLYFIIQYSFIKFSNFKLIIYKINL